MKKEKGGAAVARGGGQVVLRGEASDLLVDSLVRAEQREREMTMKKKKSAMMNGNGANMAGKGTTGENDNDEPRYGRVLVPYFVDGSTGGNLEADVNRDLTDRNQPPHTQQTTTANNTNKTPKSKKSKYSQNTNNSTSTNHTSAHVQYANENHGVHGGNNSVVDSTGLMMMMNIPPGKSPLPVPSDLICSMAKTVTTTTKPSGSLQQQQQQQQQAKNNGNSTSKKSSANNNKNGKISTKNQTDTVQHHNHHQNIQHMLPQQSKASVHSSSSSTDSTKKQQQQEKNVERWAAPSFANSPKPEQLPLPSMKLLQTLQTTPQGSNKQQQQQQLDRTMQQNTVPVMTMTAHGTNTTSNNHVITMSEQYPCNPIATNALTRLLSGKAKA